MSGSDALSRLFSLLSHPHRRVVLYYLDAHDRSSLSTLAECVTGWTRAGPGAAGVPADFETVRLELYHEHLPALADAGIVAYEPDDGTVRLGDLPRGADEILATALRVDAGDEAVDVASFVGVDDAGGR